MTPVVWTYQAIEDVEGIRAYIVRDSVQYAALVTEQIVESVDRLAEFPRSGRMVIASNLSRLGATRFLGGRA